LDALLLWALKRMKLADEPKRTFDELHLAEPDPLGGEELG
jgi:hypothetical protein